MLRLEDARDGAVATALDDAVRGGRRHPRREQRERGATLAVQRLHRLKRLGAKERRVAVKDERGAALRQRWERDLYRVPGPERWILHDDRRRAEVRAQLVGVRGNDDERSGLGRACGRDDEIDHGDASERVEDLRRAGTHPSAFARG